MSKLTQMASWKALQAHSEEMKKLHMRELFADDPSRFDRYHLHLNDIIVDYSKNLMTEETKTKLLDLARERDIPGCIDRLFNAEKVNTTENRLVLHTALRNRSNRPMMVDGKDVMPDINAVLARMRTLVDEVRSGEWKGSTGKQITDIVNIGIGGSDLILLNCL